VCPDGTVGGDARSTIGEAAVQDFAGKAAVVTGGASGIGRAIGGHLAASGGRVVLADVDAEAVERAADELAGSAADGGTVTGRPLDVRDEQAFRALIDDIVDQSGRIDLLFNNAGITMGGPTHEQTGAHWDRIIDVNLRGVVNGVLAAYPRMVEQGDGHIVNTASGAGLAAPPFVTAYAATKHAVVGLSTGLRAEAALHGVRVSVLCPGTVETPMLDEGPAPDLPAGPSAPVTARQFLSIARQRPMAVDDFAHRALRQVARNQPIIVIPRQAKVLWLLQVVSPRLVDRLTGVLARKVDRSVVRPASGAR
jgi:NAD(P)-dependent dehydrogenase (short-subunit alcohol dehydrogenase family)